MGISAADLNGTSARRTRWRRALAWLADALVGGVTLALLALPFVAGAAARDLGLEMSPAGAALPALVNTPTAGLRDMPAFTPSGVVQRLVNEGLILTDSEAMREAVEAAATRALGAENVPRLSTYLSLIDRPDFEVGRPVDYPYRYADVDRMLDEVLPSPIMGARLDAVNDLAGLLILAASANSHPQTWPWKESTSYTFEHAASVAFALLHKARTVSRSCLPQLNLAFLVSTDYRPLDDVIVAEFESAQRACPGDPTPLWLLGQFQVSRAYAVLPAEWNGQHGLSADDLRQRPLTTFRRLQRELPGSAAGWAGEADAEVSLAEQRTWEGIQPFTTRDSFRRAIPLYQRALQLSTDPGVKIGLARALAGLGRYDDAAAAVATALGQKPSAGRFQAMRLEYLERASRFGEAADEARPALAQRAQVPLGQSLSAQVLPVSIGVERHRDVQLTVGPPPGGAGTVPYDLSFVPTYRQQLPLVGYEPWCRQWSLLRDLVLAGRAGEVLTMIRGGVDLAAFDRDRRCFGDGVLPNDRDLVSFQNGEQTEIAAVAAFESGRSELAADWLNSRDTAASLKHYSDGPQLPAAYLYEMRQNLWRFAGDLDKAQAIVDEWLTRMPGDPFAADRAGEIAFLRGDYARAAKWFAAAAATFPTTNLIEQLHQANALLKAGAADGLSGRNGKAKTTLGQADQAGQRIRAAYEADPNGHDDAYQGTLVSYFAWMQLGDIGLREREYKDAAAAYEHAKRLAPGFATVFYDDAGVPTEEPNRLTNGVVENNLALAQMMSGSVAAAVESAKAACTRDPHSPIFLETLAYAYQSTGQLEAAANTYRTALDFDPTLYPAQNDLGVVLAKLGRHDEAVHALRLAVGVKPDYALGWFNLGVQLSGMGPGHFLQAQGALGRAADLDGAYRDRERQLVYDAEPYFAGLDLSRPLPPDLRFAEHQHRAPVALSAAIVLLLLGRLAWGLGLDHAGAKIGTRVLGWAGRGDRRGLLRWITRPIVPAVAVAATVAVFLWPVLLSPPPGPLDAIVLCLGVLALVGIYVRARLIIARRRNVPLRHYTWPPAVVLGAAMTGAGLAFAPVPAAQVPQRVGGIRWAGPMALAAAAATFLLIGWLTGVPTTRAIGASALVMISSILLPAKPFDGAFITRGLVNVAVSAALLAAASALLLGWL